MKSPGEGRIFLQALEACDRFKLNGRQYQVVIAAMNYPLRSRIWVYDLQARRSVLMNGKTEIVETDVQLSFPIERIEPFGSFESLP